MNMITSMCDVMTPATTGNPALFCLKENRMAERNQDCYRRIQGTLANPGQVPAHGTNANILADDSAGNLSTLLFWCFFDFARSHRMGGISDGVVHPSSGIMSFISGRRIGAHRKKDPFSCFVYPEKHLVSFRSAHTLELY
jgi:hypothetical protein